MQERVAEWAVGRPQNPRDLSNGEFSLKVDDAGFRLHRKPFSTKALCACGRFPRVASFVSAPRDPTQNTLRRGIVKHETLIIASRPIMEVAPDKITVQCVLCGARFRVPAEYRGHQRKCLACKREIVMHAVTDPPPPKPEPDQLLPGRGVAGIWNTIGGIILCVGVIGAVAAWSDAGVGSEWAAVIILAFTIAMAIVPLSVAAIINAINANTLEVRRWGKRQGTAGDGPAQ